MTRLAQTEAKLLRARIEILRLERQVRDISIEAGSLAVSDGVQFQNPTSADLCRRGVAILTTIHEANAQAAEYRRQLSVLDKQSEQTKFNELRRRLDQIMADTKQRRTEIANVQHDLGKQIFATKECGDNFAEFIDRHTAAQQGVGNARDAVERHARNKQELEKSIGLRFRSIVAICIVTLAVAVWAAWPSSSGIRLFLGHARAAAAADAAGQTSVATNHGLSQDQLALCSEFVEVRWETWRAGTQGFLGWSPTPPAQAACSGSAGVLGYDKDFVILVTNRHMLDLPDIVQSKTTEASITKYDMSVTFPTGKIRAVRSIGHQVGDPNLDLALLKVDKGDLQPGIDFVVLPLIKDGSCQTGDEVAAVGNPGAGGPNAGVDVMLLGTQTFGHISGFRQFTGGDSQQAFPGRWIQIDAALNHGNSGGPLLDKREGRYFWIGVNTAGFGDSGQQGLNLALDAAQVFSSKYAWTDATPSGISQALREIYGVQW